LYLQTTGLVPAITGANRAIAARRPMKTSAAIASGIRR
jgi:hypothetical protein